MKDELGQRFKIQHYLNPRSGTKSWRVSGIKRDGFRVRENFSTKEHARCRHIELETEYLQGHTETTVQATNLSQDRIRLAEAAFIQLGDDWDRIVDAVNYWKVHGRHRGVTNSPRIDDAVAQYLEWLSSSPLRDATKRHWRIRMNVFRNSVRNVPVCDVTADFIDDFLATRATSPAGRDTDRRAISRFFSWCIERPRRWANANPCREVKVEKGESKPPEVLTLDQCRRIMEAAQEHKGGKALPYFAVCLFGAIRPSEAGRLQWSQVNLKDREIRVESTQSKTKTVRVVSIPETLLQWLKACGNKPFKPSRKDFEAVLRKAGIVRWVSDIMRHTAISHYFRNTGSYGLTAEWAGNSEAIIKKNYQGMVSSEETKQFWAIQPRNLKTKS